jgi:hypothetical protein
MKDAFKTKPITPEEMKAWIDATWEKCQSEAWKEPRQWIGLTEAERVDIIDDEITSPDTEHWALAQAVEAELRKKNHA